MNYGLNLSSLTGKEKEYPVWGITLPDSYSFRKKLRPKNQGNTSLCVPYAISQVVELYHRLIGQKGLEFDVHDLYNRRTFERDDGMSFKEALTSLKVIGYHFDKTDPIRYYLYDFVKLSSRLQMQEFVVINLPFVLALPVNDSSKTDFWTGSPVEGFHAVVAVGYEPAGLHILNSWGASYGDAGFSLLPWDDLHYVREAWGLMF